jgi:predicted phosphodiesterase
VLIGVFSDAHGHLAAFDKALALLEGEGCKRIFYLGDSVGYIPSVGVLRRLLDNHLIIKLMGNHEDMLLKGELSPEQESICRLTETAAMANRVDIYFIKQLPKKHEETFGDQKCLFVHGSPLDPLSGYV